MCRQIAAASAHGFLVCRRRYFHIGVRAFPGFAGLQNQVNHFERGSISVHHSRCNDVRRSLIVKSNFHPMRVGNGNACDAIPCERGRRAMVKHDNRKPANCLVKKRKNIHGMFGAFVCHGQMLVKIVVQGNPIIIACSQKCVVGAFQSLGRGNQLENGMLANHGCALKRNVMKPIPQHHGKVCRSFCVCIYLISERTAFDTIGVKVFFVSVAPQRSALLLAQACSIAFLDRNNAHNWHIAVLRRNNAHSWRIAVLNKNNARCRRSAAHRREVWRSFTTPSQPRAPPRNAEPPEPPQREPAPTAKAAVDAESQFLVLP